MEGVCQNLEVPLHIWYCLFRHVPECPKFPLCPVMCMNVFSQRHVRAVQSVAPTLSTHVYKIAELSLRSWNLSDPRLYLRTFAGTRSVGFGYPSHSLVRLLVSRYTTGLANTESSLFSDFCHFRISALHLHFDVILFAFRIRPYTCIFSTLLYGM